MRIAQVAPLYESVPPRLYGGTERVVSYLTEELATLGHEVTLFASGDSRTHARHIAPCAAGLRLDPDCRHELAPHLLMLEQVRRMAAEFDVVHFHTDLLHLPYTRGLGVAHVTTVHNRVDDPSLAAFYASVRDLPLVSISDAQRAAIPFCNWVRTVHHGLPRERFRPRDGSGDYLAFVGRISPEKGVDRAIEIAKRAKLPLKIAAKIERLDQAYYDKVAPSFVAPHVEYVGEVDERGKAELLGGARALLFPIDWPEPFGLVMIEAMAVGTPVIAYRYGSVPEIIDPGVTGYIVDTIDAAERAVAMTASLDRLRCARLAARRFSARRMADAYLRVYRELVANRAAAGVTAA